MIGEVLVGILLGPSLLGAKTSELNLPREIAPFIALLASALTTDLIGIHAILVHLCWGLSSIITTMMTGPALYFLLPSSLAPREPKIVG